jgi:hypothetical protein
MSPWRETPPSSEESSVTRIPLPSAHTSALSLQSDEVRADLEGTRAALERLAARDPFHLPDAPSGRPAELDRADQNQLSPREERDRESGYNASYTITLAQVAAEVDRLASERSGQLFASAFKSALLVWRLSDDNVTLLTCTGLGERTSSEQAESSRGPQCHVRCHVGMPVAELHVSAGTVQSSPAAYPPTASSPPPTRITTSLSLNEATGTLSLEVPALFPGSQPHQLTYVRLDDRDVAKQGQDPYGGYFLGSYGAHGPELLHLQRGFWDGEEAIVAHKITGAAPARCVSHPAHVSQSGALLL